MIIMNKLIDIVVNDHHTSENTDFLAATLLYEGTDRESWSFVILLVWRRRCLQPRSRPELATRSWGLVPDFEIILWSWSLYNLA